VQAPPPAHPARSTWANRIRRPRRWRRSSSSRSPRWRHTSRPA